LLCLFVCASIYSADTIFTKSYIENTKKIINRSKRIDTYSGDTVLSRITGYDSSGAVDISLENRFIKKPFGVISSKGLFPKTGREYFVQVKEKRIYYEFRKAANKKKKKGSEKYVWPMICQGSINDFIVDRAGDLVSGKKVTARVIVPSRRNSYKFKYFMTDTATVQGIPAAVIKMRGTRFVIRKVFPDSYWIISREPPFKMIEYRGVGGVWKNRVKIRTVFE
jgi:hypothetical protein